MQKDYQLQRTKLQFKGAAISKDNISGIASSEVIEKFRARFDELWNTSIGQLTHFQVTPKDAALDTELTRHRHAYDLPHRALNITAVRNQIGIGGLLNLAQGSVQVICNKRTSKHAFILGPEVLEKWADGQITALLEQMNELEKILIKEIATEQAKVTRADFVQMTKRFAPIKVDIPAVSGHAPSAEIQI